MPKGGGGAHTSDGVTGTKGGDGQGGLAYATPGSDRLYPGSAGGHGGCQSSVVDGPTCGGSGGNGGGVIYILASEVAMTNGTISVLGEGGDTASGSGAGGSIQVEGQNITLGQAMVSGGIRNIAGGNGSSYAIYRGTLTSGVFVSELDLDAPAATPLPTPTPTAVPTLNPASAVWHTRVYNYDGAHPNRVTSTSDMDTYTYDENGNQITRTVDGVSWTLTYNAENRLASLGDGNGNNESYLYDGDGVRVARVRNGDATYMFMGGLMLLVASESSLRSKLTLALPEESVSGSKSYYAIEGQLLAMSDGSETSYLLTDHLGSVVGVVGETGSLLEERRYLPFGEERVLSGTVQTELSFTGQRELTGTGLLDYHARQYDPSLRTFIQPDSIIPNPYGVQDYNRYLYVHANPVRFTDPSGNRVCDDYDENGGCIEWNVQYVLSKYNIIVTGGTEEEKWKTYDTAYLTGRKLAPYFGGSSVDAFKQTFGKIYLHIVHNSQSDWSGNCIANQDFIGSLSCKTFPDAQNFIHELGHVFDVRYGALTGEENLPSDFIDSNWVRGFEGYKCHTYPCLEHPLHDDLYLERGRIEDFADMFLNWILDMNPAFTQNGFTTDEMGNSRRNFMDNSGSYSGMTYWLKIMSVQR